MTFLFLCECFWLEIEFSVGNSLVSPGEKLSSWSGWFGVCFLKPVCYWWRISLFFRASLSSNYLIEAFHSLCTVCPFFYCSCLLSLISEEQSCTIIMRGNEKTHGKTIGGCRKLILQRYEVIKSKHTCVPWRGTFHHSFCKILSEAAAPATISLVNQLNQVGGKF